MTDEEITRRGKAAFDACFGGVIQLPESDGTPQGFGMHTMRMMDMFWGGLDSLSMRDKRLLILGVLAGSGADPMLFRIHAQAAFTNGELDATELREALQMILPYAGYPKSSALHMVLEQMLAGEGEIKLV